MDRFRSPQSPQGSPSDESEVCPSVGPAGECLTAGRLGIRKYTHDVFVLVLLRLDRKLKSGLGLDDSVDGEKE
jgi:hypothetical protein